VEKIGGLVRSSDEICENFITELIWATRWTFLSEKTVSNTTIFLIVQENVKAATSF
jgi:hypothetical protein